MKKLILVLVLLLPVTVFGLSWCNGSPGAFNSPLPLSILKSTSPQSLDALTVQGASYFLKSHSDFSLFMQRYELNSADFVGLTEALTGAITNIKGTCFTYYELKNLATQTPYNQAIIDRLAVFDYSGFQKSRGLFFEVFQHMRSYLIRGDVTGSFVEIHTHAANLLSRLYSVKKDLDNGIVPDIEALWQVNQEYTYLLLFGQYESMVFKAIMK